jgi:5-methylcytosine-specific restriction enzyme subunit McrC
MKIPIKNIYYLLCYAWDKLKERDIVDVNTDDNPEALDLFANVLNHGVTLLLKKGVDRDYVLHQEDIRGIKGKINFNESLKRNLFEKCQVNCEFDDFSYNILHNRILKTIINKLIRMKGVNINTRKELSGLNNYFNDIEPIILSDKLFSRVRLHRNNYFYDFLLKICQLIYDYYFINEEEGAKKFRDYFQDKGMPGLFENFVRNFYKKHLNQYQVGSTQISWDTDQLDDEAKRYLPIMKTDITLKSPDKKIIIDTKYYPEIFQHNQYNGEKMHSSHLYQIFSYLKNDEKADDFSMHSEGILLYPTVSQNWDLKYVISGHKINIKTINLSQPWQQIRDDLLVIVNAV